MTTTMLGESLFIRNHVNELRRMSRWLSECAAALNIPTTEAFNLDVCANEAVLNIINYSYDDSEHHEITLELSSTNECARLIIRDDGKPFNPLNWPAHQAVRRIEDACVGGLGIHLMRHLLSRCDYRRISGSNELILEARRTPPRGNA